MVRWSGGPVVRWSGGPAVQWPGGPVVRWSGGPKTWQPKKRGDNRAETEAHMVDFWEGSSTEERRGEVGA